MLRQQLTPRTTAIVAGIASLFALVIFYGAHLAHEHTLSVQENRMNWQRDREMGIPDTGISENATEEEKQGAKTRMMEEKMTHERSAPPGR